MNQQAATTLTFNKVADAPCAQRSLTVRVSIDGDRPSMFAAAEPVTPPAAFDASSQLAGSFSNSSLRTDSNVDLLSCGLFEDELAELAELKQAHSPKSASQLQ
ncbi:hypothetical protein ACK3TF_000956 [Chlorella vulgaris]|uniref:Uncharacterized protein n=1 Tax=Chlorella vulgaris TaxID=3077 RepID=A4GUE5_CHLVU|nr:unknown [Chlorella vulgaris]